MIGTKYSLFWKQTSILSSGNFDDAGVLYNLQLSVSRNVVPDWLKCDPS
jgi:hypothetical protein